MNVRSGFRVISSPPLQALAAAILLVLISCSSAYGQATAEYAGATSMSATTAASAPKPDGWAVASAAATDPKKSQHLAATSGPPPEVVNRQALEQRAGKNACKLLLRSVPSAAQVFVDGAFVGNSPMLLVLPPGKYRVEMRGSRMDSAGRGVDLLPSETREVALSLTTRYPTRVTAH